MGGLPQKSDKSLWLAISQADPGKLVLRKYSEYRTLTSVYLSHKGIFEPR